MTSLRRAALAAFIALPALTAGLAKAEEWHEHSHAHRTPAAKAPASPAAVVVSEESLPLDPRFSPDRIRADVAFLADDLLEGRDTGSRGHEIAARFVAQRFAALGLEPAGDLVDGKRSWFQQVTLQSTLLDKDASSVSLIGSDGHLTALQIGRDYIPSANPERLAAEASAPLVFVGFGLVDKALGLDDYAGIDARGKFVVALDGFPDDLPSEEAAHLSSSRSRFAREHGALGVITVGTAASEKVYPFASRARGVGRPTFTWVSPAGTPEHDFGDMVGRMRLSAEAAKALFVGAPRSLAALMKDAAGRGARIKAFDLKPSLSVKMVATAQRLSSPNVVAILPGSDPVLKDQYIALSGHLDHIGISPEREGDAPGKDRINNGALDNATGSAVTLEVARVFAEGAQRPRRSLLFLLSTGEEKGLLGAGYYASNPTVPAGSIVGDVDLDMPVLMYPFTDMIAYGADHSTIARTAAAAVAPMKLTLAPDPMPEEVTFVRSDHYEFVKRGVPAIFLATGFANGGQAGNELFNEKYYHQPGDDMNLPLNWRAGARFAEANWRITDALANADQPPLWNEGDYFGALFAPGAPRAPKP